MNKEIKKGTLVLEYYANKLYRIHIILESNGMLGLLGTHKKLTVTTKYLPPYKQIRVNNSYNELFTSGDPFKYKFIQPMNKT